ncbi:hypothetical protein KKG41_06095 [Patescibacteria group bacterium]|nr:hypothetical protein [Patescibacteria group bacterium]MBU1891069.1 hypothetical protein [Patescibacteria group bacterium]
MRSYKAIPKMEIQQAIWRAAVRPGFRWYQPDQSSRNGFCTDAELELRDERVKVRIFRSGKCELKDGSLLIQLHPRFPPLNPLAEVVDGF